MSTLAIGPDDVETRHATIPISCDVDALLVQALRQRDPSAAERLVDRFGRLAYRLAFGITRSREDAQEAVQDAFWNVIRKVDAFRGDSAFRSWVYRIVANAACQKVRVRSRRTEIALDEVLPRFDEHGQHAGPIVDWFARVDSVSSQTELRAALSSAIGLLPPDYRAPVVMRDVEGLSMAEIAESLEMSVAQVKSRVHRARLFLRERLASYMVKTPASHKRPRRARKTLGGVRRRAVVSTRRAPQGRQRGRHAPHQKR